MKRGNTVEKEMGKFNFYGKGGPAEGRTSPDLVSPIQVHRKQNWPDNSRRNLGNVPVVSVGTWTAQAGECPVPTSRRISVETWHTGSWWPLRPSRTLSQEHAEALFPEGFSLTLCLPSLRCVYLRICFDGPRCHQTVTHMTEGRHAVWQWPRWLDIALESWVEVENGSTLLFCP